MTADTRAARLPLLRWSWIALLSLAFLIPFLFVSIPPLTDVPGHMGRYAVQLPEPESPLFGYFDFRWALVLNLGTDLLVEALSPWIGMFATTWLVSAATPVITAAGILIVARALNPRGSHALPWALIFVYNHPFLWGFINWALAMGLALVGLGGWVLLDRRKRLRAAIFLILPPLLFVGHGVAGALLPVMAGSWELWRRVNAGTARWNLANGLDLVRALWPFATSAAFLAVYVLLGEGGSGVTQWLVVRKLEAIATMLRDRSFILDVGTVLAAFGVIYLGARWGARFRGGSAGPVIALAVLFALSPTLLDGSNNVDARIAPFVPMLALALQDWSAVDARRRLHMMWAGIALLAVRSLVTLGSFISFEAIYSQELSALEHVRPGSRVLNLSQVGCGIGGWRKHRLEHLSNLATPLRGAWVNSHWAIESLHLLRVRYQPSPDYFRDPTHMVFPAGCVDFSEPFRLRTRRTAAETLRVLPLDRVDYLWLVHDRLAPADRDSRLTLIWSSDMSELYAVRPTARAR